MSEPFRMLSKEAIAAWLKSLQKPGQFQKRRAGPTLFAIARHTGIPRNTLKWLIYRDTARLSEARQALLSKTIAEIENGQLDFIQPRRTKIAIRPETPRPVARYGLHFGSAGPSLVTKDRPPAPATMPSFKNILLK